ncbi:MAG TPA: ATPase domain-containing protein [Candidatus Thermoplasmatota archaeon]|nr:ATPase domain-containing protein [Candidatus Thermoplasmatota archaeon]
MATHPKIKSGIFGLNRMLDGGLNEHSTTVVIGASGAGKTTVATQFLRRGLQDGQEGIYITLDEPPEQIVKEAQMMGFEDINRALEEEKIVFIDASGKQFREFILKELQDFVSSWGSSDARIVIDPLTPVLWATPTKYEQRELLSFLFKQAKRIGTLLATLEEHSSEASLSAAETVIPMYLADNIIHLQSHISGEVISRSVRILKTRSSNHSNLIAPYEIRRGLGVVVRPQVHGYHTSEAAADFESQWRKLVREKVSDREMPAPSAARVRQLLADLSPDPILGMAPQELLDLILEDAAGPRK